MNKIDFSQLAIKISANGHETPEEGMCIMECAAYMAGEKHSDQPKCSSSLIGSFAIRLNDRCTDEQRNTLISFVLRLVNSRADSKTEWKRAYLAADYAIRRFLPKTLEHEGEQDFAEMFRSLWPITDIDSAMDAGRAIARTQRELGEDKLTNGHLGDALRSALSVVTTIAEGNVFIQKRGSGTKPEDEFMGRVYACGVIHDFSNPWDEFGQLVLHPVDDAKDTELLFDDRYELVDEMLKFTDEKDTLPMELAMPKLRQLEALTA